MSETTKPTKKRLPFNTTISTDVQKEFKEYCMEIGIPLNVVLEAFMKQFSKGEFQMKFGKNNQIGIDLRED